MTGSGHIEQDTVAYEGGEGAHRVSAIQMPEGEACSLDAEEALEEMHSLPDA